MTALKWRAKLGMTLDLVQILTRKTDPGIAIIVSETMKFQRTMSTRMVSALISIKFKSR